MSDLNKDAYEVPDYKDILNQINEYIEKNDITPVSLIEKSNVKFIFTTNEVFDDLSTFEKIAAKGDSFKVMPAFRADKIMNIDAEKYPEFLDSIDAEF